MNKEYKDFIVEDNRIIIKEHVKAPKPITGTKIGAITNDNPFSSPFVIFMDLFRFSLPFETNIKMEKGIEYEPFVIAHINKISDSNFVDYSENRFYDFDKTKGIGSKFNGKLDGWDKDKKIVLECKVTNIKNSKKWIKEKPPFYYVLQMLLYGYIVNSKEVWLGAYFIKDEEYELKRQPIDGKRIRLWKIKMNSEFKEKFDGKLLVVEEFINNHLKTRISPEFNISKQSDRELLDHLKIKY